MERRIRKKKKMDGKGLTDAALEFDAELRREMLYVIDRKRYHLGESALAVHLPYPGY